jgi:hypothetical protein
MPTPPAISNTYLLGATGIQPVVDSDMAGQSEAFSYVASATGTAHSAAVYLDGSSTAAQVIVGVYTDSGGSPDQLLGAATIDFPTAGAWNSVPLTVGVTSGQRYWLAILQPAGTAGMLAFRDGGAASSVGSPQANLTALPATYRAGATWGSGQMSAYLSG